MQPLLQAFPRKAAALFVSIPGPKARPATTHLRPEALPTHEHRPTWGKGVGEPGAARPEGNGMHWMDAGSEIYILSQMIS
ncbi:MAG: hypothetical protein HPY61_09975 [Methanotrichaceae archaeon]|nr:hypothetical protein [Methanotrichaceae archaeon]